MDLVRQAAMEADGNGNRGTQFLQQRCERYPSLPRSIILKTDLLTRGVNYTDDLKAVGPDGLSDTVRGFKFHHDIVADDEAGTPAQLPWSFYFHDQTHVKVIIDLESPYTIRVSADGRFVLYCGDQPLEDVFFPHKAGWLGRQLSDGTPITAVLFEVGPCHATGIVPLDYCEYFKNDEQCRYCDWNPTFDMAKAAGFRTKVAADTRQLVEAFEIAFSGPEAAPCQHPHIILSPPPAPAPRGAAAGGGRPGGGGAAAPAPPAAPPRGAGGRGGGGGGPGRPPPPNDD